MPRRGRGCLLESGPVDFRGVERAEIRVERSSDGPQEQLSIGAHPNAVLLAPNEAVLLQCLEGRPLLLEVSVENPRVAPREDVDDDEQIAEDAPAKSLASVAVL